MFFVLLCIACLQDIKTGKIANGLVVMIGVTGLVYAFFGAQWHGVLRWLAEVGVYFGLLYPLYRLGVLGAGDVKIMAAMAGAFSWREGVVYFVCVWLFAAGIALGKMLYLGNAAERMAYFFSYMREVLTLGQWQFYHRQQREAVSREKSVCMAIPMLLGYVFWNGVLYMGG